MRAFCDDMLERSPRANIIQYSVPIGFDLDQLAAAFGYDCVLNGPGISFSRCGAGGSGQTGHVCFTTNSIFAVGEKRPWIDAPTKILRSVSPPTTESGKRGAGKFG